MTAFDDLSEDYRRLAAQRDEGRLSPAEFQAAAARLGLVDGDGTPWVIGARSGSWYRLGPGGWEPGDVAGASEPPPPPPAPRGPIAVRPVVPIPRRKAPTIALVLAALALAALLVAAAVRGGDSISTTGAGTPVVAEAGAFPVSSVG